jgi:hypothetical protein
MEKTAEHFLDAGCGRFDLFYMIGLPTQTSESVQQTVEYTRGLYQRFKGKRLFPFISPLAPFIDPGGNAFDDPKRHGYRILARGLDDHIALASMPSWKHVLNYETEWMTRDDIAEATYSAGLGLNSVKREMGLVTGDVAEATERRIVAAREMMHTMDRVLDKGVPSGKDLDELREAAAALNESTVCDKEELDWSESSVYASIPRMISSLLRGR